MRAPLAALALALTAAVLPTSAAAASVASAASVAFTTVPTAGATTDANGVLHLTQQPAHFEWSVPDRPPCATLPGETCSEDPETYQVALDFSPNAAPPPGQVEVVQPNARTGSADLRWTQPLTATLTISATHHNCITLPGDTTPYLCADLPDGLVKIPVSLDANTAQRPAGATTQSSPSSTTVACQKVKADQAYIALRLKSIAKALKKSTTTAKKKAKLRTERTTITKRRTKNAKTLKTC